MPDITPTRQFEEEIRAAVEPPQAREEFVNSLHARLVQQAVSNSNLNRSIFFRPAWAVAFIIAVLLVSILLIGPQRVVAAIRSLIGYLPGVGIVDQSAPIRVLAEPVSLTRDGVTVSINKATLTADRTRIDTGVSGVPLSAYPRSEEVLGCTEVSYLRLPDGTRLEVNAPFPVEVNKAVYVMPCIFNTLPDTVPTDWELPLKFVPAPPDLTVMPVIDVTLTAPEDSSQSLPTAEAGETITPTPAQAVGVSVEKVVETSEGYILIGALRPLLSNDSSFQVSGVPIIRDANGQKINYTYPQDIDEYQLLDLNQGDQPFSFQIKAAGVAFPLTIVIPGKIITLADPNATAELTFDAGADPKPGQEWTLNQEIELAGHTLKLVSITADSLQGYGFQFETGEDIANLSIQVEGYTPTGGGGGSGNQGMINQSLSFAELPKGSLKIILSRLMLASETQFWQGQWSPETVRTDWPTATPAAFPICMNTDSLSQLQPLPASLDGRVLLTEIDTDFRLVMARMDGSERLVLAEHTNRGAFSPDGQKVAYPGNEGFVILDLSTNTTSVLRGLTGYAPKWSPDGTQIAYVTSGETYGVYVTSSESGSSPKQLSNLGYESLAGWSADGRQVYYAIPGASGDGFLLRAVDISTGATQDLFTLDDSSRKAPYPAVSPDGKWVAYRASDNSSVYLKAMDGASPAWLLIDNPGLATSGIAWEKEGHLLGVSIITPENPGGVVILLQVDPCEAYFLQGLYGEVDGILIP